MVSTLNVGAATRPRNEFYSGWSVLLFSTVGAGVGFSALGYILGPLVVPLQEEFGWGRGEIMLTSLWSSIGMALALPFLGRLLDCFGVKRVALLALPLYAAILFSLSRFESTLLVFLVLYGLTGIIGVGTSVVTYSKAIIERFDRQRGLALGIVATGLGVSGLFLPSLMGVVIEAGGWRAAYITMSVLALVPLILLLFAKFPKAGESGRPSSHQLVEDDDYGSTRMGREFWTLILAFLLLGWALLTMVPHFVPMLIDSGVSPVRAALLSSLIGFGTVITRPIVGALLDRFYATNVAVPLFIVAAIGCVFLLVGGPAFAPVTAILIGIGFGAEIDLMSYLSSRYFSRRKFGTLYSYVYSAFLVGSALGTVVAGYIFDAVNSYQIPLITAATFLVFGSLVLLTLPRYGHQTDKQQEQEQQVSVVE